MWEIKTAWHFRSIGARNVTLQQAENPAAALPSN